MYAPVDNEISRQFHRRANAGRGVLTELIPVDNKIASTRFPYRGAILPRFNFPSRTS